MRPALFLAVSLGPGLVSSLAAASAGDASAAGGVTVGTAHAPANLASGNTADTDGSGGASVLHGEWVGNDAAAEAIYETISIEPGRIRWGSPGNPNSGRCETRWRLAVTGQGTTFHGQLYASSAAQRYAVYTLELEPVPCAPGLRYLQFALPTDGGSSGGDAEVVSFSADWSLSGAHNFDRR